MTRIYNFAAGPAAIPEEVLIQVRDELLDWSGRGMSVMEVSHRSKDFIPLAEQSEIDLRELLAIPDNYRVLFLPGGAQIQFSAVPMNLLGNKKSADYVDTGIWARKAISEAMRYCDVNIVASSEPSHFTEIPSVSSWQLNPDAAYLHFTSNETIDGLEFKGTPQVDTSVPLVADMSSNILSEPVEIARYGLIYASAQKNIGPAGLSLVIVRDDLLDKASPLTPHIFNYKTQAANRSMTNTPPTFAWYVSALVFKWLKKQGGVKAMATLNHRKAEKLYRAIDESHLYTNNVKLPFRSKMNVIFRLKKPELEPTFLKETHEAGLANLKGHALVGGMRASIYNAVPEKAVDALIDFMKEFEKKYL